jgi:tetratricopeptide (TPR) repeat protein
VLDDADGTIPSRPFYAESMAAYYRLGAAPSFALTTDTRRLLRDAADTIVPMPVVADAGRSEDAVPETVPLGAVLDELVAGTMPNRPEPLTVNDENRLAWAGFLAGPEPRPEGAPLSVVSDATVLDAHARAARLVGEGKLADAIAVLQSIVKGHPELGAVHFGIGQLLVRMGRLDDAAAAFERAEDAWPGSLPVALASSDVLRRLGKLELAKLQAETAIVRAEPGSPRDRIAAHETAARVALALKDAAAATSYAAVSVEVDPTSALPRFVKGRLLFDEGKYEEAVEAFSEPEPADDDEAMPAAVAELELYKGESLARLERTEDAEMAFRNEIEAFPRDPRAYLSLVTLYQATKPDEIEEVLDDLLEAVPTPEGYGLAAMAWATVGDTQRANAIRADARVRFRGDPSLGRFFGRGGRR